jgi:predicted RND superfamily exporter protein
LQEQTIQEEEEEEDPFESEYEQSLTSTSYWLNSYMLEHVESIHDYLEEVEEMGKVLSIATALKVFREVNNGTPLETYELGIVLNKLPENANKTLIEPYVSDDGNQLRFAARVYDSDDSLDRQKLIEKIRHNLISRYDLDSEQINITGMLVLYNNMLLSLFDSQISTLGAVFLAITIMFALIFRSFKIAVIAIIPNILAAAIVLGTMGLLEIPLNMMTITIAAITIGIGVDDTIHFIHRFNDEVVSIGNYYKTVEQCFMTIGRALFYTSMIIAIGFSILSLSDFVPTINFGLLTAWSMIAALVANITLLPILLIRFKA